jgi:hypothetical protein
MGGAGPLLRGHLIGTKSLGRSSCDSSARARGEVKAEGLLMEREPGDFGACMYCGYATAS